MKYFLKITRPTKKGEYLQIYISDYTPGIGSRNHRHETLGYVCDLVKRGIPDPVSHYKKEIEKMNEGLLPSPQIGEVSLSSHAGHFLAKAMFDRLGMDRDIDIMTGERKSSFKMSEFLRVMAYAQIIRPGSKLKAFERVIPNLYGCPQFSYDQILDAVSYMGSDYQKYIECLNKAVSKNWERDFGRTYFDCTNYYFEIDQEDSLRRKGPSKENRKSPIIGQALMLDSDQIPVAMKMYPGNQSEKPYLRKTVEDMKARYNIKSKIVEVADKGLNCAKNIYYLSKEGKDGYIFSKAFRGNGVSSADKEWVVLDTPLQNWKDVRDKEGNLLYRYKETVETYDYSFIDDDGSEVAFKKREKRIATYTPDLARKQRMEIDKEVDRLDRATMRGVARSELGSKSKYLNIESKDGKGKDVKIRLSLDQGKIDEDKKYAGYNLIVTSETKMSANEIYRAYHGLWRIEESFRIMKSYLEARPAFMKTEDSIYGHFLIVYVALTIMRLLELKTFEDAIPVSQLFEFMRNYNVTKDKNGSYINASTRSATYEAIKEKLGLLKLGNLYLSKKDLDALFKTEV